MADIRGINSKVSSNISLNYKVNNSPNMNIDKVQNKATTSNQKVETTKVDLSLKPKRSIGQNAATFGIGITEGMLGVGEKVRDFVEMNGVKLFGKADVGLQKAKNGIKSLLGLLTQQDKNDLKVKEKVYEEMMEETAAHVATDEVKSVLYDPLYQDLGLIEEQEQTPLSRSLGNGVGETFEILGLALTGGYVVSGYSTAAAAEMGTQEALATLNQATSTKVLRPFLAGITGAGEGLQTAYQEGADVNKGLKYSYLKGTFNSAQWLIGEGINQFTPFQNSTKNSSLHVVLDSIDGGAEGIVQPWLKTIYDDRNYSTLFKENGGWTNVGVQALIAGTLSTTSEIFSNRSNLYQQKNNQQPNTEINSQKIKDNVISIEDYKNNKIQAQEELNNVISIDELRSKKQNLAVNSNTKPEGVKTEVIEFPNPDKQPVEMNKQVVNGDYFVDNQTPITEINSSSTTDNNVVSFYRNQSQQQSYHPQQQVGSINNLNKTINNSYSNLFDTNGKLNYSTATKILQSKGFSDDDIIDIYNKTKTSDLVALLKSNQNINDINPSMPKVKLFQNSTQMLSSIPDPIRNYKLLDKITKKIIEATETGQSAYGVVTNLNSVSKKLPSKQICDNYWNTVFNSGANIKRQFSQNGKTCFKDISKIEFDQLQTNDFIHIQKGKYIGGEKLYLNIDIDNAYKILPMFMKECDNQNLGYYFKVAKYSGNVYNIGQFTRDEAIVFYSNNENTYKYVNILENILSNNPDIPIYEPPALAGVINNKIGFGTDPPTSDIIQVDGRTIKLERSYNGRRGQLVSDAFMNTLSKYDDITKLSPQKYQEFIQNFYKEIKRLSPIYKINPNNFMYNN